MPEADDRLLRELRLALDEAEPLPRALHEGALAAFGFRDVDGSLAELAARAPAAVRSGEREMLVFESSRAEVALAVEERRLVGQVAPPESCVCALESPARSVRFETDRLGRFALDVPSGPLRLVVEHSTGTVRTEWFRA